MFLAELDKQFICVGIKDVKEFINDNFHVQIEGFETDYLYRSHENGSWSKDKHMPEPLDPNPSIEEQILTENQYQTALLEMNMMGGI